MVGRVEVLLLSATASVLVTAAALVLLTPILSRFALDTPGDRSSHERATPRGGGAGVLLGTLAGVSLGQWLHGGGLEYPLLLAVTAAALVGFADDLFSLGSLPRLAIIAAVAAGLALSIDPAVTFVLTVVLVLVAFTNMFNFMDGIDALSALSAVLAAGWFLWMGWRLDQSQIVIWSVALAAAALAFLPWNWTPARMFLGDVGSYGIGFTIAAIAVLLWRAGASPLMCAAPVWIHLTDTTWTLTRRLLQGKPVTQPHREHVYQHLVGFGYRHLSVALVVAGLSGVACAITWALEDEPGLALMGCLLLSAGYLSLPRLMRPRQLPIENGLEA